MEGENFMSDNNQDTNTGDGQDTEVSPLGPGPARSFGNPNASAGLQLSIVHPEHPNLKFQPLPVPTGPQPYHLSLDQVLPADQMAAIRAAGQLVFHSAGDTGGVKFPAVQQIVADKMAYDCEASNPGTQPAFFYHLGDIIYYQGEGSKYFDQFYEPYDHYPRPILAIPGNHDGDVSPGSEPSLAAFKRNFCAPVAEISQDASESHRPAMTQPHVYWTLEAPFVTIIGLYTNVIPSGQLDDYQRLWFYSELQNAPTDKALIVALHHPPHSVDRTHGGSENMRQELEQAFKNTRCIPDVVLSGHVHNYQRFTLSTDGHEIPYIVAGAGGYWHLYYLRKDRNGNAYQQHHQYEFPEMGATLDDFCDDHHGYMRITVKPETLKGEYVIVPRPQEPWRGTAAVVFDTFTLDLKEHRLVS
jgi:acid phosphatase type 7